MKRNLIVLLAILAVFAWVPMASAVQVGSFSFGTPGTGLSASAVFNQVGTNLEITLTNTGGPAMVNADILTALFWNSTTTGLTPVSAEGHNLFTNPTTDTGAGDIGVNWVYQAASLYGNNQAISTTGLDGTFSNSNFFSASPLPPLDGINYGIAASFTGTNIPDPQFPLVGAPGFGVFDLTLPSDALISITQVTFQYGTSLDEFHTTVPIPPTALLMGSGLMGLGLVGWRRRSQQA